MYDFHFVLFCIFITLPWKILSWLKKHLPLQYPHPYFFILFHRLINILFFVFLRMHCLAVISHKMALTVDSRCGTESLAPMPHV